MTIDTNGVGNKFYFDLTARFSRSVTTQTNYTANTQPTRIESTGESNYSRANAFTLLERTLTDSLGKRVELGNEQRYDSPVLTIAKNVLSFVRQELREARNAGASEQQLQAIINQASEGIEKGFNEAKDILQARFESNPRLERQIERAFNRIQRGLQRLDNRFAPNVDEVVAQQTSRPDSASTKQLNTNPIVGNNADEKTSSPVPATNTPSTQIEFIKTRNVERTRSFQLSIQTQEGDTVNFNIEKSFTKQVQKQATLNDEGISVNIDKQIQRNKQVTYQVSGDINAQEQAAIDTLVNKIDRLADKFYRGDFAAAFQKASRIGIDAEQLANFSLNLQSIRTVQVAKTYQEVQGIPASQQTPSPVESLGEFVANVAEVANDQAVTEVVADPVPVATELFKQIAIRDERYAQLVFEQSSEVAEQVIEGIADLAEQQAA